MKHPRSLELSTRLFGAALAATGGAALAACAPAPAPDVVNTKAPVADCGPLTGFNTVGLQYDWGVGVIQDIKGGCVTVYDVEHPETPIGSIQPGTRYSALCHGAGTVMIGNYTILDAGAPKGLVHYNTSTDLNPRIEQTLAACPPPPAG